MRKSQQLYDIQLLTFTLSISYLLKHSKIFNKAIATCYVKASGDVLRYKRDFSNAATRASSILIISSPESILSLYTKSYSGFFGLY